MFAKEAEKNPFCKDNPFTAADKIYCVPGCNCIGFFFKSIKWYTDSYSLGEPRFWEDIISKLATLAKDDSDIGYYFFRQGEDKNDAEEIMGNSHVHGYPAITINFYEEIIEFSPEEEYGDEWLDIVLPKAPARRETNA